MCGITVVMKDVDADVALGTVRAMSDLVAHRGPDDHGLEAFRGEQQVDCDRACDRAWELALAHRRLAILDLSGAGHQPMCYRDRYWITYNGEVYNYLELRSQLEKLGHVFRSRTDTEVVLAAYAEWGVDCFRRFNGMWGLVIYDQVANQIIASRDRLGIKPVYVWQSQDQIAIVSEIKQLTGLPRFSPRVDEPVAREYLRSGYEHEGRSFFDGVRPIRPGTYEVYDAQRRELLAADDYWHPETIEPSVSSASEAAELFRAAFERGVDLRLRSDVRVGSFLSGGLDSSSIVNEIAKRRAVDSLHTFSAGFPGASIDETAYVNIVVSAAKARGFATTPQPDQFLQDIDDFVWTHDEPVGSLSIYASYCVARLARENGVTVILNGQGGDEVLGGYWQSYFVYLWQLARALRCIRLLGHLPGCLANGGNPTLLKQTAFILRRYIARRYGVGPNAEPNRAEATSSARVVKEYGSATPTQRRLTEIRSLFLPRLLKWDDRNTMAFSLEGRYPFLDHRLIETCLSFPEEVLYHRGWTKWPLRQAFRDSLPRDIVFRRSKFGFEVPQKEWLETALMHELDDLESRDSAAFVYTSREGFQHSMQRLRMGGCSNDLAQQLFRTLIFDKWLTHFSVASTAPNRTRQLSAA